MNMDIQVIIWAIVVLTVGALVIKMSRNAALHLLAWLIVMLVANGTTFGRVLDNEINGFAVEFTGRLLNKDELTVWSFIVLTALCMLLGKVFVALWGKQRIDARVLGLDAVERSLQETR
jgi:hypothetical protein